LRKGGVAPSRKRSRRVVAAQKGGKNSTVGDNAKRNRYSGGERVKTALRSNDESPKFAASCRKERKQ